MQFSPEAGGRGIIRRDRRSTSDYALTICYLATEESKDLFEHWRSRNALAGPVISRLVSRRILRELLAFYVCLTERFAVRHSVAQSHQLSNAIADEVREALLRDPFRHYPPEQQVEANCRQAAFLSRHIEWLRTRYSYANCQQIIAPELVDEAARGICLRLCHGRVPRPKIDEFLPVVRVRLVQLAMLMLRTPAYADLAIGLCERDGEAFFSVSENA